VSTDGVKWFASLTPFLSISNKQSRFKAKNLSETKNRTKIAISLKS